MFLCGSHHKFRDQRFHLDIAVSPFRKPEIGLTDVINQHNFQSLVYRPAEQCPVALVQEFVGCNAPFMKEL